MSDNLRMCGGCNAQLVTVDHAETTYCAGCRPKHVSPHEAWAASLGEGSRVFLQPYAARQVSARIARTVVKREGAWLTVEVADVPDSVHQVHIADCGQHSLVLLSARGAAA